MIQAYPDLLSVIAGGTLRLHVGTDHPEFRVVMFRQGATLEQRQDFGWQATQNVGFNPGTADTDWGWDAYDFPIPADWPSGAYVAMLWERDPNEVVEPDGGITTTAGKFGKALFVVRSAAPGRAARILYRVPLATFHAYNFTGGASLYSHSPGRVTMHRPGGGTGGVVTDFEQPDQGDMDELDPASSRQTFEHYDAKFIRWLEGNGFAVDYCADVDVHADANLDLLHPYGVIVSVGHDEYWSTEMRANLAAYVAQGGNLAMFSGNTCWWRIHYDQDLAGFACNRDGSLANPNSDPWWIAAKHDNTLQNENALIGVSYRNAGGWWWGGRPLVGYTVQRPDHWVYEPGVGPEFGTAQSLVGYECDGVELTAASVDPAQPAVPTYQDGTPPSFLVLGVGRLPGQWSFETRDPDSPTAAVAPHAATMGVYTASGTVFSGAAVDWARVLEAGEPTVVQVTGTVVRRLGGISAGLATLAQLPAMVALDGFYSPDDQDRHAIVATDDGNVTEIYFKPATGINQTVIASLPGIRDVAAFYSDDDGYRHAIVAQQDGTLTEVFYHPAHGIGQAVLGTFPGVGAVAAFYSPDDGYRHAIVAQQDGTLTEVFYHPQHGQGQAVLGTFPGVADVGAFYSPDDQYRHAVVLAGADVTEVFYNPQSGQGQTVVASLPGALRVSAFYAGDDAFFNRRVLVSCSDGRVHEVRFSPRAGIVRSVVANTDGVTDLGGFWTADDRYRHAILGVGNDAQEVFYTP